MVTNLRNSISCPLFLFCHQAFLLSWCWAEAWWSNWTLASLCATTDFFSVLWCWHLTCCACVALAYLSVFFWSAAVHVMTYPVYKSRLSASNTQICKNICLCLYLLNHCLQSFSPFSTLKCFTNQTCGIMFPSSFCFHIWFVFKIQKFTFTL